MYLICYMDRSNISVALPEIGNAFGLSKTAMGVVLAAFTWAYAIGQIPGGWLGDRFGPKRVLTAIMAWWSAGVFLSGAATGLGSLFGARFFLGLGEAGAFPVATRGMQLWYARSERGRAQGITRFFSRLAAAITPLIAGMILLAFGWRAIFYLFGSIGLLWAAAFHWIYRDRPQQHKGVNALELAQIRGDLSVAGAPSATQREPTPWRSILGSRNMWGIALGYGCFFFGTNFYLTWYPTYLREYRGMTLLSLGLIGAIPLLVGMVGDVVGGALTDALYKRTGRLRFSRRVVAAPAMLLSGAFVIPAALTADASTSVLCLTASFFFLELVVGPAWAVPMDVGGSFSGTVSGIMNGAGAFSASLTPLIYGYFFDRGFWIVPFLVTAGVMLLGATLWTFLIDPETSVVARADAPGGD
jgi:sugar phosphate permease